MNWNPGCAPENYRQLRLYRHISSIMQTIVYAWGFSVRWIGTWDIDECDLILLSPYSSWHSLIKSHNFYVLCIKVYLSLRNQLLSCFLSAFDPFYIVLHLLLNFRVLFHILLLHAICLFFVNLLVYPKHKTHRKRTKAVVEAHWSHDVLNVTTGIFEINIIFFS
jgi:hypothetical protein